MSPAPNYSLHIRLGSLDPAQVITGWLEIYAASAEEAWTLAKTILHPQITILNIMKLEPRK